MARVSIEDCLDHITNRFALVGVASSRTRQLMDGSDVLVSTKNKLGVTALREIAEGHIIADRDILTGNEVEVAKPELVADPAPELAKPEVEASVAPAEQTETAAEEPAPPEPPFIPTI